MKKRRDYFRKLEDEVTKLSVKFENAADGRADYQYKAVVLEVIAAFLSFFNFFRPILLALTGFLLGKLFSGIIADFR